MFFAVLFKNVCLGFGVFVVVLIQSHCFKNTIVILFYERGIYMASSIIGATKLSEQLQMAPLEYTNEIKLIKLRRENGWNLISRSKRGRMEIFAEILCNCSQQKTKTKIMYSTNLNYAQLKKHLRSLTAQGLLTINKDKYSTTQKGQRFLELFYQLNSIITC